MKILELQLEIQECIFIFMLKVWPSFKTDIYNKFIMLLDFKKFHGAPFHDLGRVVMIYLRMGSSGVGQFMIRLVL
jgi:hypothetical protein